MQSWLLVLLAGPLFTLTLYQRSALHLHIASRAALTDNLTGLGNHRAYQAALREGIAECERGGQPFSLCLVDVDNFSNGGHMPALPAALRAAGLHFQRSRNSTALSAPHLSWLVDRWAAPGWVPWANVFSAGDVAIAVGGVAFALAATGALRIPAVTLGQRRPA
jgi:hypothetical protein